MMRRRAPVLILPVLQLACVLGTAKLGELGQVGGSADGTSADESTTDPGSAATTDEHESSDGRTTSSEGSTLLPDDDSTSGCATACSLPEPSTCDVWAQDCAHGEKCAAHADDAESSWSELSCVPIAADPSEVGEPCEVLDYATSGLDNCPIGAMCLGSTCHELCSGARDNPVCSAGLTCVIANEDVITVCLPTCDPVASDCGVGQDCLPFEQGHACVPVSDQAGVYGDDCTDDACAPGFACVESPLHAACDSARCCTPRCDPDAAACPAGSVCSTDEDPEIGICIAVD